MVSRTNSFPLRLGSMVADDVGSQSHAEIGDGFTGRHGRHDDVPVRGLGEGEIVKFQVSGSRYRVIWERRESQPEILRLS